MKKEKSSLKEFGLIYRYLKHKKLQLILYIVLEVLVTLPAVVAPFIWGFVLEALITKDLMLFTLLLSVYFCIEILASSILFNPKQKLYVSLENEFTKNVTKDLYIKINKLPAKAFEQNATGEFINRLYTDPENILSLLNDLIGLFLKGLVAMFAVIFAFSISFFLGLETIVFAIVMGLLASKYFPKIKEVQKKIKEESDIYVKIATENINGIREVKSLGMCKNTEKNLFRTIDKMYAAAKKNNYQETDYYSINNAIYFILEFTIILTCGYYFINGNIAYAVFITMESYIWRIDAVVENFSKFGVNFNKVAVSLGRINDILENRLYKDETYGKLDLTNVQGHIIFKDVKFKYDEADPYTLKGLNLDLEPNKKIAIVGRSGNGKSTIFNLLLRYFEPTSGIITLDGVELKDLTENTLRKNISIIRQDPFIFNKSIIDNFKIVKEDTTLNEIREVCKKAYIDDYIMNLPKGYKTIIGEGGVNLSGGQKQRLAIARTLLLDTKVILFDEATSALDNESQEYIKRTIDELVSTHTIIIVAHRLSTIVDANEINVIKDGKLEAKGTHQELLEISKTYQNLYNAKEE